MSNKAEAAAIRRATETIRKSMFVLGQLEEWKSAPLLQVGTTKGVVEQALAEVGSALRTIDRISFAI